MTGEYRAPTAEELLAWGRAVEEVMSGRVNCATLHGPGGRIVTVIRTVDMKNVDELEQVAGLRPTKLRLVD